MNGRGPGWRPFAVSALIHAAIIGPVLVLARPPEPVEFESIQVTLVSPPPTDAAASEAEPTPVEQQPQPEEPAPEPEPEPEPEAEEPQPEPEPPEPDPDTERPETAPPPETETEPDPEPEPETTTPRTDPSADSTVVGGEGLNIRTEGREFPYPDYINNVLLQVRRYFRWDQGSRPRGVVYFEILRDGSVRGIRMVRSSGNIRFDFAVQGAVETAGNRGAFGPLPEGYVAPSLPVQLEVEPPR